MQTSHTPTVLTADSADRRHLSLEMTSQGLTPDLLNLKPWGWDPPACSVSANPQVVLTLPKGEDHGSHMLPAITANKQCLLHLHPHPRHPPSHPMSGPGCRGLQPIPDQSLAEGLDMGSAEVSLPPLGPTEPTSILKWLLFHTAGWACHTSH